MNELQKENSPYLLQHATNPIFWKAWNKETLQHAKENNTLIIISIGYAACHWCHVMEHESFEDEAVAKVMNSSYTSIKVDREERPDIDAIYMKAIQIMSGQGGWPLNVVCLPDGRPVWGGTYFKKEEWTNALEQLQLLFETNPEKMIEYAEKLHEGIQLIGLVQKNNSDMIFSKKQAFSLIEKWQKSFDLEYGGYSRSPKFMMPTNLEFLQRYGFQNKDQSILKHVDTTLTKMAYGGLFDTVEGGFSRYSVDIKWHIPHFEKMLYDNAQLLSIYANAYKRTKNELYKEVIEKTILFCDNELLNDKKGYFASLDADSLNEQNHLEEGAFYSWTKEELKSILKDDFDLFANVFNINSFGYWEEEKKYVLIQNQSLIEIASANAISVDTLKEKKKNWEQQLYIIRKERKKPRLDDKSITSWNALLIKGFVDSYKALNNQKHLDKAINIANFITNQLWNEAGFLWHTYKKNTSKIEGFLEDYAFTIEAFITLYQVTLDYKHLLNAKQLTDYCLEHFYNENEQFFSFTSRNSDALIASHYEIEDNVIPASNSVMGHNLYALSIYYENSYYEKVYKNMLAIILPTIDYASAFSNWLSLWMNTLDNQKELAVCGTNALKNIKKINNRYLPNIIVAGSTAETNIPFLNDRFDKEQDLFYLCSNRTCQIPEIKIENIINQIENDYRKN
ncbi:thioredoxin domain-containing protein [Flavobacterium jejuense]|uniref:Thioredoxin domain-containing protein n=1 Tax=Flavobacterium jejuense TaxID=1544455 RepID=A0ABX0IUL3_9FLAO|nr:thioredoxin domain-containing protein [Flavobacterium jejuense]NHN27497.1 thioredoxin domain-containing protein [Flavobacterium jejuense]